MKKIILILLALVMQSPLTAATLAPLSPTGLKLGATTAHAYLHATAAEIAVWNARATSGPYKTAGDVSTNSPGDWTRIANNRNAFAANPTGFRWIAPVTSGGCVPANSSTYGWPESDGGTEGGVTGELSEKMRDTAFYDLVMGVTTDHAALKVELLRIAGLSYTQFGNAAGIWCFGQMSDSAPSFGITTALTKLLFAYDYMGRAAFSSGELDTLDRWFFDAADFWRRDMDNGINGEFVDRWNGNYTRIDACSDTALAYVGGPNIQNYAKFYNNRRGNMIRFATFAGIYLTYQAGRAYTGGRAGTQAQLIQSGQMYAKEYIRFSVFPQGAVGDYERRTDALPDLGWGYASNSLAAVVGIADAFARVGDTSIYTYNTALGECGTAGTISDGGSRNGQNRDLLFAVQAHMKYITDVYARYHLNSGNPDFRIDGRNPRSGTNWSSVHDTNFTQGNMYFRDSFITQAYTRTHANSVIYGFGSAPISGPPVWMGENGIYPGMLFMWGQLENNAANPFGGGAPPTPRQDRIPRGMNRGLQIIPPRSPEGR